MQVHPELLDELKQYGTFDISACFNCGNCTAVCRLAQTDASFPRRLIRCGQTGLQDSIQTTVNPWLCYYCGECSETCPRQASPAEYMMALRRYLIGQYDITGISKLFFRNSWVQSILTVAMLIALFAGFMSYVGDFGKLAAMLEVFFPVYVSVVIVLYLFQIYRYVIIKPLGQLAFSIRPRHFYEALYHGFTQINFTRCEKADLWRWRSHWLVMSGYVITLLLSNLHLLEPLHRQYTPFAPVSLLIWYAGLSVTVGGGLMLLRRVRKSSESSKHSHPSDWLFVTALFLIGLTVLATHIANVAFGPESAILGVLYKLNIAIETTWIVIVVPFSKWIHIFFRPLAIYLHHTLREVQQGTAFTLKIGQRQGSSVA